MLNRLDDLTSWVEDHPLVAASFIIVTGLLVAQRLLGWNWDFMVYMMSGEYLFGNGIYIEWYRAPVTPFILGLYRTVLPRLLVSILFVVTASSLFLYAAFRVSKRYDVSLAHFYILLASPFVIMQGTFHGTEMLALAFGMLFIAELDRPISGLWLSLAFLTRYNFVFAVPLVLLQFDIRKTIKTYAIAAVPVFIWGGYNWQVLGDPFTSVANSIALNVRLRTIVESPDPLHFLLLSSVSSIVLVYYLWKKGLPSQNSIYEPRWIALGAFTVLITASYLRTPVKPLRYLYPFAFPVAVAGAAAWKRLEISKHVLLAVAGIHLLGGAVLVASTPAINPDPFKSAASSLDDCQASSNNWPHLSYVGIAAEPVPDKNGVRQQIEDGYRVVLFRHNTNPSFIGNETFLSSLPTLEETGSYIIAGDAEQCRESQPVNETYFTFREERLAAEGIEQEYEPCQFLLGNLCRYIGVS